MAAALRAVDSGAPRGRRISERRQQEIDRAVEALDRAADEEWELGTGDEYDQAKFYTAATRQSENLGQVRVSTRDALLVGQILSQRLVPEYRTTQDLVRDAIHHRLRQLEAMGLLDGELRSEMRLSESEQALERLQQRQRTAANSLALIRDLLAENRRDIGVLQNLLARTLELSAECSEQKRDECLDLARQISQAMQAVA